MLTEKEKRRIRALRLVKQSVIDTHYIDYIAEILMSAALTEQEIQRQPALYITDKVSEFMEKEMAKDKSAKVEEKKEDTPSKSPTIRTARDRGMSWGIIG